MIKDFHSLFRELACSDDTPPLKLLTERLQGMPLDKRIMCLKYLQQEYRNGQIDFLHEWRVDNETFMRLLTEEQEQNVLGDELIASMDGRIIIDATIEKFRKVLDEDVPRLLLEAEYDLVSLQPDYESPVRQARTILDLVEDSATPNQTAQPAQVVTPPNVSLPAKVTPKITEDLTHDEAAVYLKMSTDTLYKQKVKFYKLPGGGRRYRVKDLEQYQDDAYKKANLPESKPASEQSDQLPSIRHNKGKGKK